MDIFLGQRSWSACRGGEVLHAESERTEAETLPLLMEWLTREGSGRWWAPLSLSVTLSGAFCRPFLLPQLPLLTRPETMMAIDAAAKRRTGLTGDLQVWLSPVLGDAGPEGAPHQLGAAVSISLVDELVGALQRVRGFKLRLIQPLWSLALRVAQSHEEAPDLLLVRDPDSVTVLAGRGAGSLHQGRQVQGGYTTAIAVEAPLETGQQRAVIMRLVSGLDDEPKAARQFVFKPNVKNLNAENAKGASRIQEGIGMPLALWSLDSFDLATV